MKIFPCPTRKRSVAGLSAALLICLLAATGQPGFAQTADKRIETIRDAYNAAKESIERAERGDESSEYFVNELVINRAEAQYPAVGTYRSRQRFYYTYGDRSQNPYPDRLRMVLIETLRAGVVESEEYLFADTGDLIFYFNRIGDGEQRLYFADRKLIRRLDGQISVSLSVRQSVEAAKVALETASKLYTIFRSSL